MQRDQHENNGRFEGRQGEGRRREEERSSSMTGRDDTWRGSEYGAQRGGDYGSQRNEEWGQRGPQSRGSSPGSYDESEGSRGWRASSIHDDDRAMPQGRGDYGSSEGRYSQGRQGSWPQGRGTGDQSFYAQNRGDQGYSQGASHGGYGDQNDTQHRGGSYGDQGSSQGMNRGGYGGERGFSSQQRGGWSNEGGHPYGQGNYGQGNYGQSGFGQGSLQQGGYGQNQGQRRSQGRGPSSYTRSDQRIYEDICDALSSGDVDAAQVEVKVEKGEVTLTGTVSAREDKRRIEDLAERVSGVKDVNNQLKMQREQSAGAQGSLSTAGASTTMSSTTGSQGGLAGTGTQSGSQTSTSDKAKHRR